MYFNGISSSSITGECLPSLGGSPWRLRQEAMPVAWDSSWCQHRLAGEIALLVHVWWLGAGRGFAAFTAVGTGSAVAGLWLELTARELGGNQHRCQELADSVHERWCDRCFYLLTSSWNKTRPCRLSGCLGLGSAAQAFKTRANCWRS